MRRSVFGVRGVAALVAAAGVAAAAGLPSTAAASLLHPPGVSRPVIAPAGSVGSSSATVAVSISASVAAARARAIRSRMTLAQEVGQLIMAGAPATDPAASAGVVADYRVGAVFLAGRSHAGVTATAAGVSRLRAGAPAGLWVATDQEGGFVQVLNGPGFSPIPTALAQSSLSFTDLRYDSTLWAGQLSRAGLNVDLAPVADVVPGNPAANPPIGWYSRQYGSSIGDVVWAVRAVVPGYTAAGVSATVKHFPGLGRVTANTDTTADVVDAVTTRSAANESPFRAALTAGAGLLMVSSARYTRIDAGHLAVFSPTVIGGMVRGDLGWQGVVISDDLANARAVAGVPVGSRAVSFVAAGGDVVLTVDPRLVPAMATALIAHARGVPAFRAQVDASVLRVLTRKAQLGLLPR